MAKNSFHGSPGLKICIVWLAIILSTTSCMILESTPKNAPTQFPNDSLVDRSFVSEQPCKAPCWYGLELGKARADEIRTTLSTLPFIKSNSIREYKNSEPLFIASCVYSNPDEDCVWIETSTDGTLSKIVLKTYYPLTLESVIERLGNPTYYISDPISGRDACQVHVYWPNASVMAILEVSPKERYCIGKNSEKINLGSQIEQLIYTRIEAQQDGIPWIEDQWTTVASGFLIPQTIPHQQKKRTKLKTV